MYPRRSCKSDAFHLRRWRAAPVRGKARWKCPARAPGGDVQRLGKVSPPRYTPLSAARPLTFQWSTTSECLFFCMVLYFGMSRGRHARALDSLVLRVIVGTRISTSSDKVEVKMCESLPLVIMEATIYHRRDEYDSFTWHRTPADFAPAVCYSGRKEGGITERSSSGLPASTSATQPGTEPCQLTFRAVATGLVVGSALCCSNTYFGLQSGW